MSVHISSVYMSGVQLCKAWNEVQKDDSCRVRKLTICCAPFFAYTILQTIAAKDLQFLSWDHEHDKEAPMDDNLDIVNQFDHLTHLILDGALFMEWPKPVKLASTQLVVLHLNHCLYACFQEENEAAGLAYSLSFINSQQMLQDLQVSIATDYNEGGVLTVASDLYLPCLQKLHLACEEHDAVLSELTLQHVPASCSVTIENLSLAQESARARLGITS